MEHLIQSNLEVIPIDENYPKQSSSPPTDIVQHSCQQHPERLITDPLGTIKPAPKARQPNPAPPTPPNQTNETKPPLTNLANSGLSVQEESVLAEMLTEYSDVFSQSTTTLGRTGVVCHKIGIGTNPPILQRPYPSTPYIEDRFSEMLQTGLIQPSDSPWSAPVILVRKKEGQLVSAFIIGD